MTRIQEEGCRVHSEVATRNFLLNSGPVIIETT